MPLTSTPFISLGSLKDPHSITKEESTQLKFLDKRCLQFTCNEPSFKKYKFQDTLKKKKKQSFIQIWLQDLISAEFIKYAG